MGSGWIQSAKRTLRTRFNNPANPETVGSVTRSARPPTGFRWESLAKPVRRGAAIGTGVHAPVPDILRIPLDIASAASPWLARGFHNRIRPPQGASLWNTGNRVWLILLGASLSTASIGSSMVKTPKFGGFGESLMGYPNRVIARGKPIMENTNPTRSPLRSQRRRRRRTRERF